MAQVAAKIAADRAEVLAGVEATLIEHGATDAELAETITWYGNAFDEDIAAELVWLQASLTRGAVLHS
jgi:hypothetical protein